MKNKGFTLIELLAVIIILGILMIIAIPSVTRYISDSRKSVYIDTAHSLISGARNMVNEGKLQMFDTDTTYYINSECIKTEGANKSPYGEFEKAYVVVNYNGKGYDYYWTSIDEVGNGVKSITSIDNLNEDSIESDLTLLDIKDSVGIDGRNYYVIINKSTNCEKGTRESVSGISCGDSSQDSNIIFPTGKDRSSVEIGEIVTIGTEEFYVIGKNGCELVLLAHYNINIGSNKNPNVTEGIQHSSVRGRWNNMTKYGNVPFSSTDYWKDKVGSYYSGSYCNATGGTNCAYLFDENSTVYPYLTNYKNYLGNYGVNIKKIRLMNSIEYNYLSSNVSYLNLLYETTYWTGYSSNVRCIFGVEDHAVSCFNEGYNKIDYYYGVRPVIEI